MSNPFTYKLSIIIVNYNVEYFLEQCLNSVRRAAKDISCEIWVVDNNSVDGSAQMLQSKFPEVKTILNKENTGFSRANNQAIRASNSEYVLLLNPDTVVEEDTFKKCISFMDAHANAGALGVRMVDGKGKFLPESKRGLPTPMVAFYKVFGLSRLFPKSKRFGQYHLGHLEEFHTNKVDILSGAYMFMRTEALNTVGLLDETFFMYGEDIDLSYRIQKGGYDNYYFPETRIIHYKGESTKKSSVNYVFVFYKAMIIFAQKHFSQKNAKYFSFLINIAVYFRAALAIFSRIIRSISLPIIDLAIILIGLMALTNQWHIAHIDFPSITYSLSIPAYASIWLLSNLLGGTYDAPARLLKTSKATFAGTAGILIAYALLPKELQFSRLFILIGSVWVVLYYLISRIYLHFAIGKRFNLVQTRVKRFAIIGDEQETDRVHEILKHTSAKIDSVVFIAPDEKYDASYFRGNANQLEDIVRMDKIDEVIFCAKDVSAQTIISKMIEIASDQVDFKIAQPDSISLIGSNSIDTAGDLYVLNINAITKRENMRKKRMIDLLVACCLFALSPLLIWTYSKKVNFLRNILQLTSGSRTLVGYHTEVDTSGGNLPKIKPGILTPFDGLLVIDGVSPDKLNLIYARDYSYQKDLFILLKGWKKLDR